MDREEIQRLESRFAQMADSVVNAQWKMLFNQIAFDLSCYDAFIARSTITAEQPKGESA